MARFLRNSIVLAMCLLLGIGPTQAQGPQSDAAPSPAAQPGAPRSERLAGLSRAELQLLEPFLQNGPIALAEFTNDKDAIPAINVATLVHAPAASVVSLIRDPRGYPRFMRTFDEVEMVQSGAAATVYDWRWQVSLLSLRGRNAMTVFAPPPEHADNGYRITIDSLAGDLGTGRTAIRVLPHGERECLLVISMRVDLRNANYVARQIAKAARSMNRSANMSLASAMMLSLRREAEKRAGYQPPARAAAGLTKPALDAQTALPLLMRGDLVLLDMTGDTLNQIAVFGVIMRDRALVREVMLDADSFGAALVPGSTAKVIARQGSTLTFEWDVNLPLVGVSGRMRMRDANPIVAVDAVEGALQGGRWNFETQELGQGATLIANWAKFDVRSSTWFVRKLAETDPYLGHGMSAAGEVMLVRALRSQAGKRAEARLAAARTN